MSRWKSDFLRLIAPEAESLYRLGFSDPDVPAWQKLALREQLQRLILHVLACYMRSTGSSVLSPVLALHTLDCIFVLTGRSELTISWSDELKVAEIRDRLAGLSASDLQEDVLLDCIERASLPYARYDEQHGCQTQRDMLRVVVLFAMSLALIEARSPEQGLHQRLAALLLPEESFSLELLQRRIAAQPKAKPAEFIWMSDPSGGRASARLYFIRKQEGDSVQPGDEFGYAYSQEGMYPILCGLRGKIKDIFVHNGDMVSAGGKLASVVLEEEEREEVARWLR